MPCRGSETKQIAPIGTSAAPESRLCLYLGQRESADSLTKPGYLAGMTDELHAPKNADWRDTHQTLLMPVPGPTWTSTAGIATTPRDRQTPPALDLSISRTPIVTSAFASRRSRPAVALGDHFFDLVPGKPQISILPFRMRSSELRRHDAEQGLSTTHHEGVQLIEEWISAMQGRAHPLNRSAQG